VVAAPAQHAEAVDQIRRAQRQAVVRAREHSDKANLCHGTRRPAIVPIVGKPIVRNFVVDVVDVEKRHQHVHVEQRDPIHSSSLSSFTRIIVISRDPAGRWGRSGTPLRIGPTGVGVSAFRANSESTLPAVVPCASAS
jgi:hypothetical protein